MANDLLISYDLYEPQKNYARLEAAIKLLGDPTRIHKSFWYVQSDRNGVAAMQVLKAASDASDRIVVIDTTNATFVYDHLNPEVHLPVRMEWTAYTFHQFTP